MRHHLAPHGQHQLPKRFRVGLDKFQNSFQCSTPQDTQILKSKRKANPSTAWLKDRADTHIPIKSKGTFTFETHQHQGISDQLRQHYRVTQEHKTGRPGGTNQANMPSDEALPLTEAGGSLLKGSPKDRQHLSHSNATALEQAISLGHWL